MHNIAQSHHLFIPSLSKEGQTAEPVHREVPAGLDQSVLPVPDILEAGLAHYGVPLYDQQKQQFLTYAQLLVEWNSTRMNLTRLTSVEQIAIGHFMDSIAPIWLATIPHGARVLDIGAGAGFPGLPLKIVRPDIELTLLEATQKKLVFCQVVADALGLDRVGFVHGRAGEGNTVRRHSFDLVTARAVAPMFRLIDLAGPYMQSGTGMLIAWKGPAVTQELKEAEEAMTRIGIRAEVKTLTLTVEGEIRTHCYAICRWKAGQG